MSNAEMQVDDPVDRGLQLSAEHNVVELCAHIADLDKQLEGLPDVPDNQQSRSTLLSTRADSLLALRMIAKQFDSEKDSPLGVACGQLFELISQLQEVEQQYTAISHNASQKAKDQLKAQWDTLTTQVATSENSLVQLINSNETSIVEYLELQKDVIQNQQRILRDQRKQLNAHTGKIAYTPTRDSKRSKTAVDDSAESTQNLLHSITEAAGGLSQDNVNTVEKMRKAQADALKPDEEDPLHTDEQTQLMLHFGWDQTRPTVLQSSVRFTTEGKPQSWKGLDQIPADLLPSVLPSNELNLLISLKDSEISQFSKIFSSKLHSYGPLKQVDFLIELPNQSFSFQQWSEKLHERLPVSFASINRLSRAAVSASGTERLYVIASVTQKCVSLQLKPLLNSVRLMTRGVSLEHQTISLPEAAPNTRAIHVHEKDLAFIFGKLGITRKNRRNVPGPVNVRPTTSFPGGRSKVFCYDMDEVKHANLIRDFSKLDFFASMPISVYEGEPYGDCELVLELFYKKTHKEQYAKSFWAYVYKVLKDHLIDQSLFPLQVAGFNKLRLGLRDENAAAAFLAGPLVEFRAAGILLKNEKQGNGSTA